MPGIDTYSSMDLLFLLTQLQFSQTVFMLHLIHRTRILPNIASNQGNCLYQWSYGHVHMTMRSTAYHVLHLPEAANLMKRAMACWMHN